MKRVVIPELLDSDAGTAEEIAASIADLRGINRRFGGISTSEAMVRSVVQSCGMQKLSLLEVAAGSGFVPNAVRERLAKQGLALDVTLLDRAQTHLNTLNGSAVVGDALALPFGNGSFDLVSCCLFAHHLSADEIRRFVEEGLRVCRVAVLINDLVRHRLHLALTYAGMPLFHSRITRHDAVASVRRAYTRNEMLGILKHSKAGRVEIREYYLFRMGVIAWKNG
jgi:ubiquinone/menaquinone biosynthesis C-methylase UbiE